MKKLYIIKIGGNIIDNGDALTSFIDDISGLNEQFILVHGGGKMATAIEEQLGIKSEMIDGRRVTDAETLKVVVMVYAGLINKQIVAKLQAKRYNAIGLSGADANIITAQKRNATVIDYGFVGDVDSKNINASTIKGFIENGFIPVIAPITHDGAGQLLNTNADTVASSLAIALSAIYETHLIYCFEKNGVLENTEDENSVIPVIASVNYENFKKSGMLYKGMIPKLDNAFHAIHHDVSTVIIGHASHIKELVQPNTHAGTKLIK